MLDSARSWVSSHRDVSQLVQEAERFAVRLPVAVAPIGPAFAPLAGRPVFALGVLGLGLAGRGGCGGLGGGLGGGG